VSQECGFIVLAKSDDNTCIPLNYAIFDLARDLDHSAKLTVHQQIKHELIVVRNTVGIDQALPEYLGVVPFVHWVIGLKSTLT
jgi:hypothetical protein